MGASLTGRCPRDAIARVGHRSGSPPAEGAGAQQARPVDECRRPATRLCGEFGDALAAGVSSPRLGRPEGSAGSRTTAATAGAATPRAAPATAARCPGAWLLHPAVDHAPDRRGEPAAFRGALPPQPSQQAPAARRPQVPEAGARRAVTSLAVDRAVEGA